MKFAINIEVINIETGETVVRTMVEDAVDIEYCKLRSELAMAITNSVSVVLQGKVLGIEPVDTLGAEVVEDV